jgi:hypothetical protein
MALGVIPVACEADQTWEIQVNTNFTTHVL